MSWMDIVVIVIIAVCALIGIGKGAYKSMVSLFGNFLSMVAAFFLSKVVALAILEVPAVNELVFGKVYPWLYGFTDGLIDPASFFYKFIQPIVESVGAGSGGAVTEAQGVALMLSYLLTCLVVFIALFIVIRIVMAIIFKIIGSLINRESPGMLSRLIGMIVGAVKGGLYVTVLMLLLSFSLGFPFMQSVTTELSNSTISIQVYDAVKLVSDKIFVDEGGATIDKLIEISKIEYDDSKNEGENEPADVIIIPAA